MGHVGEWPVLPVLWPKTHVRVCVHTDFSDMNEALSFFYFQKNMLEMSYTEF